MGVNVGESYYNHVKRKIKRRNGKRDGDTRPGSGSPKARANRYVFRGSVQSRECPNVE